MLATELWEALERCVDERTVFRDLQYLQAAGFPLESEEGRWRVMRQQGVPYTVPVQTSELLALCLASELLEPYSGMPAVDALQPLHEKLMAMLTPKGRAFVQELRGSQVASYALPGDPQGITPAAERVHEAIEKEQVLRIRYRSPKRGPSERDFDPYAHWCFEGRAYVIGHCHLRQAVRVFLLARIEHAEVTGETFERDPAFDPRQHVEGGFGVWIGERHPVALLFAPEAAHLVRERRFHSEQSVTVQTDGSLRLEMEVAGLPVLASWLAGTGGAVRALKPRVLADMVREIHEAGLAASAAKPPVRARTTRGGKSAAGSD